jgi:carboxyl-terminal processing protease
MGITLVLLCLGSEVHAEKTDLKGGIVRQSISLLEQNYVNPGEADTLGLIHGALEDASRVFPSLSFRLNPPQHPGKVIIRAGGREVLLQASESQGVHELRTILPKIEAFLSASLPNGSPERIGGVLVKGMLKSLDPFSALLSPAEYELHRKGESSWLVSIGLRLKSIHGLLTVTYAHPDSPAGKAGVLPGDRIFRIGDTPSAHLEAGAAAALMQGRPGSRVRLLVMRPNQPEPLPFAIRRGKSPSPAIGGVSSHVFKERNGRRIGYLKVASFQENTPPALREHFQRLRSDLPGMVGLVLDLRGNPGGYLKGALQVADLFLSRGTIVAMRGASGESEVIRARWYRGVTSLPLVVLADRRTASSAEIVAGALRFNQRGLVIGETTFGKHSIQSIFPLAGGSALKLTVATFQTGPAGATDSTDSTGGIVPHVMLVPVQRASEEGAYHGILDSLPVEAESEENSTAAGKPLIRLPHAMKDTAAPRGILSTHPETSPDHPKFYWSDYALGLARRLLNGNHPGDQASLLRGAGFFLRREKKRQEEWIQEMLGDRGIDWSRGAGENTGAMKLVRAEIHTRDGPGNS